MRRHLSIVLVVILLTLTPACLDNPEPPGTDIPRIVIDSVEGENNSEETIIYLQRMEPIQYENITLSINETDVVNKENSFGLEYRTSSSRFNLSLDIEMEGEKYNFNATFIRNPKRKIAYRIIYYSGEEEEIEREDLPFFEPLDEVEEET